MAGGKGRDRGGGGLGNIAGSIGFTTVQQHAFHCGDEQSLLEVVIHPWLPYSCFMLCSADQAWALLILMSFRVEAIQAPRYLKLSTTFSRVYLYRPLEMFLIGHDLLVILLYLKLPVYHTFELISIILNKLYFWTSCVLVQLNQIQWTQCSRYIGSDTYFISTPNLLYKCIFITLCKWHTMEAHI